MRYLELRRHADNDGDRLTPQGVVDAEAIGSRLHPPDAAFISTEATCCTQKPHLLRPAAGEGGIPSTEAVGRRSFVKDR